MVKHRRHLLPWLRGSRFPTNELGSKKTRRGVVCGVVCGVTFLSAEMPSPGVNVPST